MNYFFNREVPEVSGPATVKFVECAKRCGVFSAAIVDGNLYPSYEGENKNIEAASVNRGIDENTDAEIGVPNRRSQSESSTTTESLENLSSTELSELIGRATMILQNRLGEQ